MPVQRLAYFVSSHGFGHAARAAAVIDRLFEQAPELQVHLFAGTPDWFFEQSFGGSLPDGLHFHPWETDVGLVQATALAEDMQASLARLSGWYPLRTERLEPAVRAVAALDIDGLVADISPLGLAVAEALDLPSVLVENFTWTWIYRGYGLPELDPFADALEPHFENAGLNLRTAPFCGPLGPGAVAVDPVARRPRRPRDEVRRELGLEPDESMILVTMGGVPWDFTDLESHLSERGLGDCRLVVAGGAETPTRIGRAHLIPHRSSFYHPDLVQAADAVVAKLGYSTIAEVAGCGCRLGYVPRPSFPESPELEPWVHEHLAWTRIEPEHLEDGSWLDGLGELLAQPARAPIGGGAETVARHILAL